ncbi:hypothetical protein G4D82_09785 [Flavobacterium sp. CYK-4]|uniref:DUF6161 domain-containing protein n=1 Tax=Flavobacterium lotistagni TaxID=2709660 RepID=UPI00140B112D|nr:DUF6161 domain-containing protein [Flavobacterium lotistagni]NHM07510.1 hypothetical protein [Flavobacterium lotistagni]
MNISELNKFLKSDLAADIKDLQFTLEFPSSNFENVYEISTLYRYAKDQVKKWDSYETLPPELLESRNYFATIQERIEQLVENIKERHSRSSNVYELESAVTSNSSRIFPGDSTEAIFLMKLYKESSRLFAAAFAFFTGRISYSSFSDKEYLQGVLMAVLHKIAESPSSNRTAHEKASFNSLKNRVEKYVSESDKDFKELFKDGEETISNFIQEFENLKKISQKKMDKWFELNQASAKKFMAEVQEEKKNIERAYKELLQLQAPAQHWRETSEKLLDEGHMFMRGLFALIILGGVSLYLLLWKTPEGMLASFFNGDKASAIRWSIVFITFLSLLFIGIQSLRKAMFSSFHLARDAQEREKLTMYYLSLIKEGAIGNEEKNLILQSLFSRADSGLLKEDSSPSMPGLIDKLKT